MSIWRCWAAKRDVLERPGQQDPGVVQQDVQTTTAVLGELVEPPAELVGVGDIEMAGDDPAAGRLDLRGECGQSGVVDVIGPDRISPARAKVSAL